MSAPLARRAPEPRNVHVTYRPHRPDAIVEARRVAGLHPQEAFHRDRYRVKYRAALAGTGGGKTYGGAFEAISLALENPGSVGALCEPDYPMINRNLVEPGGALHAHLGPLTRSPLVKRFNRQEHLIEYANGSLQWLLSLEEPEKAEGANLDYVWVDEARLVRHWTRAWAALKRRLRGSVLGARSCAWITTHSPSKEIADEFEGAYAREHPTEYRVYRWGTRDNPSLAPGYVAEVERSHTGAAYKLVVLGEHARPEGLVYSEFDPSRHVQRAPPRSEISRVTYGVDWGWTLPACILPIGWQGERAHVLEEFYRSHASDEELEAALEDFRARWGAGVVWCDASRPEAIAKLRRRGWDARPYKGKVADGVAILNGMYRGDELLVDPECVNVLRELDVYAYPPGKTGDEPEKGNDHAMDAKRYGIVGARKPALKLWSG